VIDFNKLAAKGVVGAREELLRHVREHSELLKCRFAEGRPSSDGELHLQASDLLLRLEASVLGRLRQTHGRAHTGSFVGDLYKEDPRFKVLVKQLGGLKVLLEVLGDDRIRSESLTHDGQKQPMLVLVGWKDATGGKSEATWRPRSTEERVLSRGMLLAARDASPNPGTEEEGAGVRARQMPRSNSRTVSDESSELRSACSESIHRASTTPQPAGDDVFFSNPLVKSALARLSDKAWLRDLRAAQAALQCREKDLHSAEEELCSAFSQRSKELESQELSLRRRKDELDERARLLQCRTDSLEELEQERLRRAHAEMDGLKARSA
ncbi:unnamed protein product, partial [Polarella glacialis]